MLRFGRRLQKVSLFFRTIPSERTNEVNIELPPGTNWDIGRNDRGVYLRKVIKPRKYGDFHQLSNFVDLSIAEYRHVRIESKRDSFIIPFPIQDLFFYLIEDARYPIGNALPVINLGDHRFRCGDNLEFILSLVESFKPKHMN